MKTSPTIGKLLLGILYACIAISILVTLILIIPARSPKVLLGDSEISVSIADTLTLQEKGLSGREQLRANEGMLFIFPNEDIVSFWMKDMNFPIDIIWFNKNRQIVDVWENAQPSSYPELRTPQSAAQYVLEVPSGFFVAHHLLKGDTFTIK